MKKFLALCLTFSMFFAYLPTTVYAYENNTLQPSIENTKTMDEKSGIAPLNTDYWTTQLLYIGNENGFTKRITVPKGQNLKVHFSLSKLLLDKMELYILVSQGGSYTTVAHWTTEGHHWADIVTNTNGGNYIIKLIGPAYVSGGFYSEP